MPQGTEIPNSLPPRSMWEGPVDGDLISLLDLSSVTNNLNPWHGVLLCFPAGICKIRVDIKWWRLQSSLSIFHWVLSDFVRKTERFWGVWHSAECVGLDGTAGCHPEQKACQWWACKCHGFSYSSFEASMWDLVGSLTSLSCNSNYAWSWQQWALTPFKNISSYCFSREGPGSCLGSSCLGIIIFIIVFSRILETF